MQQPAYIGIDVGTSGCRAIAIDEQENVVATAKVPLVEPTGKPPCREQNPEDHWQAVKTVLKQVFHTLDQHRVEAISVDATSGSIMLADKIGKPITAMLMYNDARAEDASQKIAMVAPAESGSHGANSGLAKAIFLQDKHKQATYLLHQADWINFNLGAPLGISDENNALKTGYDPIKRNWPAWLSELVNVSLLPKVVEPGTIIGQLSGALAAEFSLAYKPNLIAGTTDSIAALLATGASQLGDAVTSLGSTLVVKLISDKAVFNSEQGIYSHRLGERWLVGGASNTGGAVLQHFFTTEQLATLSKRIDCKVTPPEYYPLLNDGERFPVYDLNKKAILTPRPEDDVLFLNGLLTGIAKIEKLAYKSLVKTGTVEPLSIRTVGGGASNTVWQQIREKVIQTKFIQAAQTEAAYGTALLAKGIPSFKGEME